MVVVVGGKRRVSGGSRVQRHSFGNASHEETRKGGGGLASTGGDVWLCEGSADVARGPRDHPMVPTMPPRFRAGWAGL